MTQEHRSIFERLKNLEPKILVTVGLFFVVASAALLFVFLKADSDRDLRAALPAESIGFVRISDIGQILEVLNKHNTKKWDVSRLKGMQVALAVTDFEAKEQVIDDEVSVLNLTPKFAAVAETNLWNWQLRRLLVGPVNKYLTKEIGNLNVKDDGWMVWSGGSKSNLYLKTDGSRVFFGNDEAALANAYAANRGDKPSLLADEDLASELENRTDQPIFGYFPKRAIEKFADIAGISAAVAGTDDGGARMLIARIVPQLMRKSVQSIIWSGTVSDGNFEDTLEFETNSNISDIFDSTIITESKNASELLRQIPEDADEITRYQIKKPQIAFRSLVLVAAKNAANLDGRIISAISSSLLEPYGINDAELFLSSVGPDLITFTKSESTAAIVSVENRKDVEASLIKGFVPQSEPGSDANPNILVNTENEMLAVFAESQLVIGEKNAVELVIKEEPKPELTPVLKMLLGSSAAASTAVMDSKDLKHIADTGSGVSEILPYYFIQTDFRKNKFVRIYKSKRGLIGDLGSAYLE